MIADHLLRGHSGATHRPSPHMALRRADGPAGVRSFAAPDWVQGSLGVLDGEVLSLDTRLAPSLVAQLVGQVDRFERRSLEPLSHAPAGRAPRTSIFRFGWGSTALRACF